MSTSPLVRLTFGVEIEFAVRFTTEVGKRLYKQHPDALSPGTAVYKYIASQLRNAGIPAVDRWEKQRVGGMLSYDRWYVDYDSTIDVSAEDYGEPKDFDGEYRGIELQSRILPATREGFDEVRRVMHVLRDLEDNKGLLHFRVNDSTGLHVHVGNRSEGFTVSTMKKFANFMLGFEHIITSVHNDSRLMNKSCRNPSEGHIMESMPSTWQRIAMVEDIGDDLRVDGPNFVRLMNESDGKPDAYNFTRLLSTGPMKTIEFRQHAGVLDAEAMVAWAEFATGAVEFCHYRTASYVLLLISGRDSQLDFTFLNLLETINKGHLVDFYGTRLHKRAKWRLQAEEPSGADRMLR
ncbi:hypothetical protein MMC09_000580 [Bachmanniomyces sp. S44760]|nr:hypothetical protein [Bachmanniomyces sp. S44760]